MLIKIIKHTTFSKEELKHEKTKDDSNGGDSHI